MKKLICTLALIAISGNLVGKDYFIPITRYINPYIMKKELEDLRHKEKMGLIKDLEYSFRENNLDFKVNYLDVIRLND